MWLSTTSSCSDYETDFSPIEICTHILDTWHLHIPEGEWQRCLAHLHYERQWRPMSCLRKNSSRRLTVHPSPSQIWIIQKTPPGAVELSIYCQAAHALWLFKIWEHLDCSLCLSVFKGAKGGGWEEKLPKINRRMGLVCWYCILHSYSMFPKESREAYIGCPLLFPH